MSVMELKGILIKDLGYSSGVVYFLKSATCDQMLFVESDDFFIQAMAEILKTKWEVEMFCDHPVERIEYEVEDDAAHRHGENEQPIPAGDNQSQVHMELEDQHGETEQAERDEHANQQENPDDNDLDDELNSEDTDEETWEARKPCEVEFGFELSEDEVNVDGKVVDMGPARLI